MNRPLYKSTVVVWSEFPGINVELSDLARHAETGDAICTRFETTRVDQPASDADFNPDAAAFFESGNDGDAPVTDIGAALNQRLSDLGDAIKAQR